MKSWYEKCEIYYRFPFIVIFRFPWKFNFRLKIFSFPVHSPKDVLGCAFIFLRYQKMNLFLTTMRDENIKIFFPSTSFQVSPHQQQPRKRIKILVLLTYDSLMIEWSNWIFIVQKKKLIDKKLCKHTLNENLIWYKTRNEMKWK